jgi:hypothetical protein
MVPIVGGEEGVDTGGAQMRTGMSPKIWGIYI